MDDIFQNLRDALAAKEYAAILYKMVPRIIREAEEGRIVELPEPQETEKQKEASGQ